MERLPGDGGAVNRELWRWKGEAGQKSTGHARTAGKQRQKRVWDLHLEERLDLPVSLCRGLLGLVRGLHGLLADLKQEGGGELRVLGAGWEQHH